MKRSDEEYLLTMVEEIDRKIGDYGATIGFLLILSMLVTLFAITRSNA